MISIVIPAHIEAEPSLLTRDNPDIFGFRGGFCPTSLPLFQGSK